MTPNSREVNWFPSVAILTEASRDVGTGHVFESYALLRAAQKRGLLADLWVNQDASAGLLESAPCSPHLTLDFIPSSMDIIAGNLLRQGISLAVTNFRRIINEQVMCLQNRGIQVVCIDELGNIEWLDAIFNGIYSHIMYEKNYYDY